MTRECCDSLWRAVPHNHGHDARLNRQRHGMIPVWNRVPLGSAEETAQRGHGSEFSLDLLYGQESVNQS
jgi:hypothetical protein